MEGDAFMTMERNASNLREKPIGVVYKNLRQLYLSSLNSIYKILNCSLLSII